MALVSLGRMYLYYNVFVLNILFENVLWIVENERGVDVNGLDFSHVFPIPPYVSRDTDINQVTIHSGLILGRISIRND